MTIFDKGFGLSEYKRHATMEFRQRQREFDDLVEDSPELGMIQFQYPDFLQHYCGDPHGIFNSDELSELYRTINETASSLKETAEDAFDTVLFMSDHGLPMGPEHNKKAFYSCNRELFPNKTPRITDFHDKILELCDAGGNEEK